MFSALTIVVIGCMGFLPLMAASSRGVGGTSSDAIQQEGRITYAVNVYGLIRISLSRACEEQRKMESGRNRGA
jgi:hypothetical protein